MCELVDRSNHISVDDYGTDACPMDKQDELFKNVKGDLILPISEFFNKDTDISNEERQQINYFAMTSKRGYNSDQIREHICQYMNYFEKFYDTDKELLMHIYNIKFTIDYIKSYDEDAFMDDINKYIIRNRNLAYKISHFVADNYNMRLSSNNGKTPNLQFCNYHAKLLYEISLLMNMYIPLASHYCFIRRVKDIPLFMLKLFDMCIIRYEEEQHIYLYDKIYETTLNVTNKSKNADKPLWLKNNIRGRNPTLHTSESVEDIILNIMPKYTYTKNIINFNYYASRRGLSFKITDIGYELQFVRLSSSKRDEDQNSEFDKYEARLSKKDKALSLQNQVSAESVYRYIEELYGPFSNEEVEHYRRKLTRNGSQVINELQFELLGYVYYKYLGDPTTWKSVPNTTAYIKMMIAAKRMFLNSGMALFPYILGGKVLRISTRKMMSKKDQTEMRNSALYPQFVYKYNNPSIRQDFEELVGKVESSSFEIIDWDTKNNCPSPYDGKTIPMQNQLISEEMLYYAIMI